MWVMWLCVFIFFFQAEDGIRDIGVTGVQTCALPIYRPLERYSAAKRANGGRSTSGPRVDSADSASGSDSPARTAEARLSTTSGHTSRRSARRLTASRRTCTTGSAAAKAPNSRLTVTVPVVSRTTTVASRPSPSCRAVSWTALMPVSPAAARSCCRRDGVRERSRRCGARGPLRQTSSRPTPSSNPSRAPVTAPPRWRSSAPCPTVLRPCATSRARSRPPPGVVEQGGQVEAGGGEALGVRRVAGAAHQPAVAGGEDVGELDDAVLGAARDGDDLAHPAASVRIAADVHDQVDTGGHRGDDEGVADVLAGQQRQGADLRDRLPGAVGVQGAQR